MGKAIKWITDQLQDIKDERRKVSIAKAANFAKQNRNCMIFLLDIKSDDMVAAYRDKYMAGRAVSKYLRLKTGLVKTIILGRGDIKKRRRDIVKFKEFIGEFLWQVSDKVGTPQENALKQREELKRSLGNKKLTKK